MIDSHPALPKSLVWRDTHLLNQRSAVKDVNMDTLRHNAPYRTHNIYHTDSNTSPAHLQMSPHRIGRCSSCHSQICCHVTAASEEQKESQHALLLTYTKAEQKHVNTFSDCLKTYCRVVFNTTILCSNTVFSLSTTAVQILR